MSYYVCTSNKYINLDSKFPSTIRPDFGGNSGGGGKNLGEVQQSSSRPHGKLGLRMAQSQ
jgi:hypothetical protein